MKMKVKVTQSCPTLCEPKGLFSLWNSPGQNTGVGSLALLQGIVLSQGSNPGLPHCRWILYQLSHKGSPTFLDHCAKMIGSIGGLTSASPCRCHLREEQTACQPCPPLSPASLRPGPQPQQRHSSAPGRTRVLVALGAPWGLPWPIMDHPSPGASRDITALTTYPPVQGFQVASGSSQGPGVERGEKETQGLWCLKSPFNVLRLPLQIAH